MLESVVEKYPSADWNWTTLSRNPAISFEFIKDHPELPWKPAHVSRNPAITEDCVRTNLDRYPWDLQCLCSNPTIGLRFFNEFMIKPASVHHVDWFAISSNPAVTLDDVRDHPNFSWSDYFLSTNPNVNSNFVLNEGRLRKWNSRLLCSNPGIVERDIYKNTLRDACDGEFEWDYSNLSANINLPIAYVADNLDCAWNFYSISKNVSLTDIQAYHNIAWDGHGLSSNPNVSFGFVKSHPDIEWHVPALLSNGAIALSDVDSNLSWFCKYCEPAQIASYLSLNSSITYDWIVNNANAIDWNRLSSNVLH